MLKLTGRFIERKEYIMRVRTETGKTIRMISLCNQHLATRPAGLHNINCGKSPCLNFSIPSGGSVKYDPFRNWSAFAPHSICTE
ncbi:Uncharacterized protein HZ326_27908 [Fusarium oxysporum f. sp. albedinis]|nr:Uncharacterized protein HZ326_27908 [Fusarium oxysporum f. sp. albedinis]